VVERVRIGLEATREGVGRWESVSGLWQCELCGSDQGLGHPAAPVGTSSRGGIECLAVFGVMDPADECPERSHGDVVSVVAPGSPDS
jgi:hypothetical protein